MDKIHLLIWCRSRGFSFSSQFQIIHNLKQLKILSFLLNYCFFEVRHLVY